MKRNLLLFASALVLFWSCDEVLTTDVSTDLTQEINVDAQESGLKNAELGIPFDVTETLNFSDNEDVAKYLDNIQEINFESTAFTVNEIPEGIMVDITISLVDYGISQSYTGLSNGSVVELSADNAAKLNNAAEQIKKAEKITINVKGTATASTSFKVLVDFAVKITAGL